MASAFVRPKTSPKLSVKGFLCVSIEVLCCWDARITKTAPGRTCSSRPTLLCNRDSRPPVLPKHRWMRAGQSWSNGYCCKEKEKGKMRWIEVLTWSSLKCMDSHFFSPLPVLSNTLNRIKWRKTSKTVTFMCLYTKNKKAANNWASIRESAALFCSASFSFPALTPKLFVSTWPGRDTR